MTYLHIAQKNSIAKQIADILSQNNRRLGTTLSKFNPVYHFQLAGQPHTFSSVRGHIFNYELPPECKSWGNFDNLKILTRQTPMVKKKGPDMDDLVKNLQALARNKKNLMLWLDCDRQGEAIAFEVIEIVKRINPTIKISRARFSAVTRQDIINAYQHVVQPNERQADAVNYRIQIDFRMGCAFTRYQTVTLQKKGRFQSHTVVSYGPCQVPTLGFVVERYLQIKNFKSEKYWSIAASILLDQNTFVELKWRRPNNKNQLQSNALFYNMFNNAHRGGGKILGKVINRNKQPKTKYRPYPLTTVKFQKLVTDKLKLSSAVAMQIAERLYQKGYISYPRTETDAFAATVDVRALVQRLNSSTVYGNYVKKLVDGDYAKPKAGKSNDQAHSPIHPVKIVQKQTLTNQQWRIYDLICRHFLACCSKDAKGIQSQLNVNIGGQQFRASHLTITQKNYLQIYPFEKWVESQFPGEVPDQFQATVELKQGKTQPPSYLSESDLIGLMEKNQIGTDATIHEHIETIQDRKYAIKANNTFKPTTLGASLIIAYKAMETKLQDCFIRRMMEQRMNRIAEGSLERQHAVNQTLNQVIPIYRTLVQRAEKWVEQMMNAMSEHATLQNVKFEAFNSSTSPNSLNDNSQDVFRQNTSAPKYICFRCQKPGHVITNCPQKDQNKKKSPQKKDKNNYSSTSNTSNNSNKASGGNSNKTLAIVCYSCKEPGHFTSNCPQLKKKQISTNQPKGEKKKFACFICGQEGHFAPACPNKKG